MKKMMNALILMLAIGSAALVGCSTAPADDGNDLTPAIQTVKASALQSTTDPELDAAALGFSEQTTALTCPRGWHESCYLDFGCGCCPSGKVLDCFGPDDCYCCSGTTCM
jgi:hypothetical protein